MKLFLTSSTITSNLVKPFENLTKKKINGLSCVFIPDAAYGVPEQKDISWVGEERQFLIDNYGWKIKDLVLKDTEKVSKDFFKDVDVVFVNGGFSGYLAKEMRRTGFDKSLPNLFKEDIVYVGSSAGSMVMSDVQDASSWYINEPEPEAKDIPGLGYIDFQIYPHIKTDLKEQIEKHVNPKLDYYLLTDGSAISIDGEDMSLHGEIEKISSR